jgi:hypothetical protein
MGLPPVDEGAVNATVACVLPAVAAPIVGAPGVVARVTLLDGADAGLVPRAFLAVTVNVYVVPAVNPVTVIGLTVPVAVLPPGLAVTVYPVTEPVGAVKLTVAWPVPAVAVTLVGGPGTTDVEGLTELDAADAGLVPIAFVAVTLNV